MNRIEEFILNQDNYISKQGKNNLIQKQRNLDLYQKMKEEYHKYVISILNNYKIPQTNLGYYYLIKVLIYTVYSIEKTDTLPSLTTSVKFVISIQPNLISYKSVLWFIRNTIRDFIKDEPSKEVVTELANEVLKIKENFLKEGKNGN